MNEEDTWQEDARTDRAIELLRLCAAKTDADGNVVPTYRYSRQFGRVAEYLLTQAWASRSEVVTLEQVCDSDGRSPVVTITIDVEQADGGSWIQVGTVRFDEGAYCQYALAACRALLDYRHDSGERLSTDEVISMLEDYRRRALERVAS